MHFIKSHKNGIYRNAVFEKLSWFSRETLSSTTVFNIDNNKKCTLLNCHLYNLKFLILSYTSTQEKKLFDMIDIKLKICYLP